MSKSLTITWRDEAYGHLCSFGAAFRVYGGFSETAKIALHRIYGNSGFSFDHNRSAWIARGAEQARGLVAALQAAGWTVAHAGRWPDGPPAE